MSLHRLRALCAGAWLLSSCAALAQALSIPDTLDVQEINEAGVLDKMRKCHAKASQDDVDRMKQRVAKNDATTLTTLVAADERNALVEKRGLWACIAMSPSRYPILPVDSLSQSARPTGGDPERVKEFFRAISRALAETGFARALVPFAATGNANVFLFAANAEQPGSFAVESRFVKKGEFDPAEYAIRIDDPAITGVTSTRIGGENSTRVDVFAERHPKRTIANGFLIRTGNDRTRNFAFGGTIWKSPTMLSASYSFQKEGVLVHRARNNTSFGSWKLSDGVLYFDINKTIYYSAVLDERDYLDAEARRNAVPPGGSAMPAALARETRFKTRFFQEGNAEAEKEAKEKLDTALKAFKTLVDMRKSAVLAEPATDDQRAQAGGGKYQTLCEGPLLGMATMLGSETNASSGELCMSYLGPRAEWKNTILKEGCKGRCAAF